MSTDERAFLNAIIAAPDDDLPRLVYADWLQENGRPERAEFIRLQCELAQVRIADPQGRERYDKLTSRLRGLQIAHLRVWEKEATDGLPTNRQLSVLFGRGMVAEVSCTAKYFLEHGEQIISQLPLRRICLTRMSERNARALATFAPFRRIAGLRFDAGSTDADLVVSVLTICPLAHLRSLRLFDFVVNSFPAQRGRYTSVAETLARCESLSSLEYLDLSAAQIGEEGSLALAQSTALPSLEYLDLMYNSLSQNVCEALRDRYGDSLVLDYPDRQRFPIGRGD
jgi:uncharacterized protein (TIGR02996 family)